MSEKKRVVKNSLLYAVSTLLTKAVNFFLLPVLTVYLTPEDYGIVSLVQVVFERGLVYCSLFPVFCGPQVLCGLQR